MNPVRDDRANLIGGVLRIRKPLASLENLVFSLRSKIKRIRRPK